jgi:diguanylate cyclase (GGDEF)-like protein
MQQQLVNKLATCPTLPSLPAVAVELVQRCRRDDFDLMEVSNLLSKDPALAAKVLSVANSTLFAGVNKITTVSRAVMRLGTNTVMTLALSFSLVRVKKSPKTAFDYTSFWKRALVAAAASKRLAREVPVDGEEAFLAGLFQDIGMLALAEVMKADYVKVAQASGGDHLKLAAGEREKFGADHAEVGGWLAERWNLPDNIKHSALASHDPSAVPADAPAKPGLVPCVAVAGRIADIWAEGDRTVATEGAAELAQQLLGLASDKFAEVLTDVATAIPDVSSLFEVKVGDRKAVQGVLDQAKEALVAISLRSAEKAIMAQAAAETLAREKKQVEEKAARDGLTGLLNRTNLDNVLRRAFETAVDTGGVLSVVFCDIDHFKSINDNHGHGTGDRVLQAVARILEMSVRQGDIAGRYGGEEFVLVLPGTPANGAVIMAERVRERVSQLEFPLDDGGTLRMTISLGIATRDERWRAPDPQALLKAADSCLYAAKRGGRNRVISFDSAGPEPPSVRPA